VLSNALDKATADSLHQYHGVDGDANTVVRIGQAAVWTNGKPTCYEYDSDQEDGENIQVGVVSNIRTRRPPVKASSHDCKGHEEEEDHDSNNSMS